MHHADECTKMRFTIAKPIGYGALSAFSMAEGYRSTSDRRMVYTSVSLFLAMQHLIQTSKMRILCMAIFFFNTVAYSLADDDVRLLRVVHDCRKGCKSTVEPICAEGITFQNECLAYCQGLESYLKGRCKSKDEHGDQNKQPKYVDSSVHDDFVSASELKRFDGFLYTGVVSLDKSFPVTLQVALPNQASDNIITHNVDNEKESEERDLRAIRVTSDGALYVTPGIIGRNDTIIELSNDNGHRNEKVLGDDTRRIITDTGDMPFKVIGELDYTRFSEGGCTGSIIGASSVLTAGHCVYNQRDQKWQSPYSFSPGR